MGQPRTLYEILDLNPDASTGDVEAGFKRAMETFSDDALASYALYTPDEADRVRREIQLAYAVLSHASSRSAYDAALASATDKAAATLSFTTKWECPHSGTTSISDGRVSPPPAPEPAPVEEKPAEDNLPKRQNTGRIVVIAAPVEDAPARTPDATPAPDIHAAETLPPLPAPAPSTETAAPAAVPSSVPVSMTPTEPPTPAPDVTPAPIKFKRVRVDDDSVAVNTARAASPAIIPASPASVPDVLALQEDAEVNGAVLQRLREARGISLKTMSEATKVSVHYLKAIESNTFSELPTRVYLRGFLIQYARALKVSPEKLANGYLAFADRRRSQLR